MAYGIIYFWYCDKTNMGYVGQTINTLSGRWKGHVRSALNPNSRAGHWEFPKAIREHGVDAFVGRVICDCNTPEELSLMEDHWIHELNTLWPNGYNMRDGTNFVCDQTRQRISERTREAMAKIDPEKRKVQKQRQRLAVQSPEIRQKISERTKEAMQDPVAQAKMHASRNNNRTGYKTPEVTKQKLRDAIKRRKEARRLDEEPNHV